ncbi:MAG: nitroreductase [Paenibacillaceae bacterium]|nr:nitroreductase [Paenibacillaceae bacterium]
MLVDRDKCLVCGICEDVCPAGIIAMGDEGPVEEAGERCIICGHCVAACPTEALDNSKTPLSEQTPVREELKWDGPQAKQFLRSRRSIRSYLQQQVPREELQELMDAARYAPTASNSQSISFLVISDPERLRQIWKAVIAWMEERVEAAGGRGFGYFKTHIAASYEERDNILRGAPHLILALCPEKMGQASGRSNAEFVLAYAELYAPAMGLGTCWGGFVQACAFHNYEPLLKLLGIPEGKLMAGALMAGYPKERYYRLVDRKPLDVVWE